MVLEKFCTLLTRLDSGNEIGPFRAVEESTLAHISSHETLSDIFAWYALAGTAGTALGIMSCGWVVNFLKASRGWQYIPACRIVFFIYAAVGIVKLLLNIGLSQNVEAISDEQKRRDNASRVRQDTSAETRPLMEDRPDDQEPRRESFFSSVERNLAFMVINLFILLGLDAFASGLASLSWMTYFFKRKFELPEGKLGSIFFTTNIISSASMLVASSIAKRIGNVKVRLFNSVKIVKMLTSPRQWSSLISLRPSPYLSSPFLPSCRLP